MWEDATLRPNERVVAYVYARYAGATDISWCVWDQLRAHSGIKSRDAINRAVRGLEAAGWLEETEKARQHYSARYRLTIPDAAEGSIPDTAEGVQESGRQTPEAAQQSGKRTPEPGTRSGTRVPSSPSNDTSSPFPDTSSPFNGPDISNTEVRTQNSKNGGTLPPDPLRPQEPPSSALGNDRPRADQPTGPDANSSPKRNHPNARAAKRGRRGKRARPRGQSPPLLAVVREPEDLPPTGTGGDP